MIPFRIDAAMAEPVVTYGDGLHLDGPLSFACFMDMERENREKLPPIESPWVVDFDLPLERWNAECDLSASSDPRLTIDGIVSVDGDGVLFGAVWGWKCSAAIPVGSAWQTTHAHRRRPAVDEMVVWSNGRRVELGGGPRGARNLLLPAVVVRNLRWYAVGDPERTLALLNRHVVAIGKMAGTGQGRVLEWKVSACDNDWSMTGPLGENMRRVPARGHSGMPMSEGSIRPPYHHRSRWVWSIAPEAWRSGC